MHTAGRTGSGTSKAAFNVQNIRRVEGTAIAPASAVDAERSRNVLRVDAPQERRAVFDMLNDFRVRVTGAAAAFFVALNARVMNPAIEFGTKMIAEANKVLPLQHITPPGNNSAQGSVAPGPNYLLIGGGIGVAAAAITGAYLYRRYKKNKSADPAPRNADTVEQSEADTAVPSEADATGPLEVDAAELSADE